MNEIHYAAARGDMAVILSELERGVDISHQQELKLLGLPSGAEDLSQFVDDLGDSAEEKEHVKKMFSEANENRSKRYEKTPLILAAGDRRADTNVLHTLLDRGSDINAKGGAVETCALGAAIRQGSLDKVRVLVEHGADIHYLCSGFGVWLDVAYCYSESQPEIVDYFLDKKIDFEIVSKYGEHAARIMSSRGKFRSLKKMLDHGAKRDPLKWNELMWRIVYGTLAEVERSLSGDDLDLNEKDSQGRSAWLLAAQVGDIEKSKLLLQRGMNVDEMNQLKENALFFAVQNDCHEMASWLLSKGLLVDHRNSSHCTPLHIAAERNAVQCMEVLIKGGADPKAKGELYDQPISAATKIDSIRILCREGADVNFVGRDGYWPLNSAVEANDLALVKDLLALGANPDTTSTGETALHKAFYFDYLDIAEVLIEFGANINAQDVDGYSVLHCSQTRKAIDIAMKAGVDTTLLDDIGQTDVEVLDGDLKTYLQAQLKNR